MFLSKSKNTGSISFIHKSLFYLKLNASTDNTQPTVEALYQHHQHWRTLATLQRAKLGFLQQERSNLQAALRDEDPFRIAENQVFTEARSNKTASVYNALQDSEYYENSYGPDDLTGYFPEQFNHSNKSLGSVNKDPTVVPQDSLTLRNDAQRKLGSNNLISSQNQPFVNPNGVEDQWETLVQSSESKRDTSRPSQQHFLRAVKNSIAASQHLQRYIHYQQ